MCRGVLLVALRSPLLVSLCVLASLGACTTDIDPNNGWTGGEVAPAPVVSLPAPGLTPFGEPVATGVVISGHELIIVSDKNGWLAPVWRRASDGRVIVDLPPGVGEGMAEGEAPLSNLRQIVGPNNQLVEFGNIRADVDRILVEDQGRTYEARFTHWTTDPALVVFWLYRFGSPYPENSEISPGETVPREPERYPLVTAYLDGRVVVSSRIRPPAERHR